jgi:hypothetical protein
MLKHVRDLIGTELYQTVKAETEEERGQAQAAAHAAAASSAGGGTLPKEEGGGGGGGEGEGGYSPLQPGMFTYNPPPSAGSRKRSRGSAGAGAGMDGGDDDGEDEGGPVGIDDDTQTLRMKQARHRGGSSQGEDDPALETNAFGGSYIDEPDPYDDHSGIGDDMAHGCSDGYDDNEYGNDGNADDDE